MNTITATTTITANEIQMGIEHAALVIAQWDAACEDETIATDADVAAAQERVAKMFAEINAMTAKEVTKPAERKMSSVEASMPAWMLTGRTTNGTFSGRGTEPAAPKAAAPAEVAQAVDVMIEQVDAKLNENATQAEPGPVVEPVALRPVRPEQKAYFVTWATSSDASKKYTLLCQKATGMAVNCSCPSRTYRKGRACKHMGAHNAMLAKPAQNATQAA